MSKIRVQIDFGNGEYEDFTTEAVMMSLVGGKQLDGSKETKSLLHGHVSKKEQIGLMAGNIQSFLHSYKKRGLSPVKCLQDLKLAIHLAVLGMDDVEEEKKHSPKEELEMILKELLKDLQNSK
jgi:hypothetical protein